MSKGKKAVIIVVAILLVLVLIALGAGIFAYVSFKDEIKAVGTYEKYDDGWYFFEYDGDYGMEEFLSRGASSDKELAGFLTEFLSKGFYKSSDLSFEREPFACSTIAASNAYGDKVCGRNFDWDNCAGVVIKTKPNVGYSSICTANIDFLGFGTDFLPEEFQNKIMSLAAIYVPLDGMNEKGLCVADLIIRVDERTEQNTDKTDLTTTTMVRLLLDRAANVDEAIDLLKSYDMHASADMMHHLSISDASGKSVVVEYVGNEMVVTETNVVTNFYITDTAPDRGMTENNVARFDTLTATYENKGGIMTEEEIKNALISVEDDTEWSIVYNKTKLTATYYHRGNYDKAYEFSLSK